MNDVGTTVTRQEMIVESRSNSKVCRIFVIEVLSVKHGVTSYWHYGGESSVQCEDYDRYFRVVVALEKVKIDRYGGRE